MAKHELTCAGCGSAFVAGRVTAKWCLGCKSPKNRHRDIRRLEDIDPEAATTAKAKLAIPSGLEAAALPLRLALALCRSSNERLACMAAGLDPDSADAADALTRARAEFPDICAGDLDAYRRVLHQAADQTAVSAMISAATAPPNQAGAILKALMQSIELDQQGAGRRFAHFELHDHISVL